MNDNYSDLINNVEKFFEDQKAIKKKVQKYLKDRSVPLEERWSFYLKIEEKGVLENDSCGNGYVEALTEGTKQELCLSDDFGMSKHETRSFSCILEYVEYEDFAIKVPEENLNSWKEEVLKSGYDSFTWDW